MIALDALGLKAAPGALEKLANALAEANGTRKVRLMTEADVEKTIADALTAPQGVAFRHGGEANVGEQRTTLCLAVRHGKTVTVGVVLCPASGAGPGRAWKKLQPWSKSDMAKNLARAEAWAKAKAADRVQLVIVGEAKLAKPPEPFDDRALMAEILANPDRDEPRAVLADALTERGDPRGEFITLQLQLAKRPGDRALAARVAELAKAHAQAWVGELRQLTMKQEFRRGFVFAVTMRADVFATRGHQLFRLAPIYLRRADAPALKKVAQAAALAWVRELRLDRPLKRDGADVLARSLFAGNLRALELDSSADATRFEALLAALPSLEVLRVPTFTVQLAKALEANPRVVAHVGDARGPIAAALERAGRLVIEKAQ